jgi:hypothetical protein
LKRENQAALDELYSTGPAALEAERNRFAESQRARAKDYIMESFIPQTAEQLGSSGLYDSGELGALVSRKFADSQAAIEQERLAQEQADIQFFADMSYKTTYQNLIDSQMDVRSQIANESTRLRQNQANAFNSSQSAIDNRLQTDLLAKEQSNSLSAMRKQADANASAQKGKMYSDLGRVAVTAGGAALGGPGGAAVASQLPIPSRLG